MWAARYVILQDVLNDVNNKNEVYGFFRAQFCEEKEVLPGKTFQLLLSHFLCGRINKMMAHIYTNYSLIK